MKALLRENRMIVVSVALPLLVVAAFAIATLVPRVLVDGPVHGVVLAVETRPSQPQSYRIDIDVTDGRLRARVIGLENSIYAGVPRLFEWIPDTDTVHEIELVVPSDVASLAEGAEIPVPGFDGRRIVTTLTAPDGWQFERGLRGGNLFAELFGAGRRGDAFRLVNNGAVVPIELPAGGPYYTYDSRFLGWVVD